MMFLEDPSPTRQSLYPDKVLLPGILGYGFFPQVADGFHLRPVTGHWIPGGAFGLRQSGALVVEQHDLHASGVLPARSDPQGTERW